jgi:hypothetical protein
VESPEMRCSKEYYYQNILEFTKEMFPLSAFAYVRDIHKNELIICNRSSRKLGFKQKIRMIQV